MEALEVSEQVERYTSARLIPECPASMSKIVHSIPTSRWAVMATPSVPIAVPVSLLIQAEGAVAVASPAPGDFPGLFGGGGGGGGARGRGGAGVVVPAAEAAEPSLMAKTNCLRTTAAAGGFLCGGGGGDRKSDGHAASCPGGGGGGGGNSSTFTLSGSDGGDGNYGGGGGGGGKDRDDSSPSGSGGNGGFGGGGGASGTHRSLISGSRGGNGGFGGGGGFGVGTDIDSNGAPGSGGAFGGSGNGSCCGGGGGALGGAIFNDSGTVIIRNSTFTNNDVDRGLGGSRDTDKASNGADAGAAVFSLNGSLIVENTTISGNFATGSDNQAGGGVVVVAFPLVMGVPAKASLTLSNTILSRNGSNDCLLEGDVDAQGSGNLILNNNGCPGVAVSEDPHLAPLALDRRSKIGTPTMALPSDSPAVDAADDSRFLATDQRGIARPQGPHSDIGAFEFAPVCEFGSPVKRRRRRLSPAVRSRIPSS